jgi:adenylosuccinate synthase
MIVDTGYYVQSALKGGKTVLAEGANAALLDLDHGTYPYVTSSSTTAGGVCTGLGIAPRHLTGVVGVVKAYTTRVGSGPFPTELEDATGEQLRKVGGEFGTTTGRPRRCGWLDIPVIQYGHQLNGYDSINITKLDVLTGLPTVKIATSYTINGKSIPAGYMPSTLDELGAVEVQYEELPGWSEDLSRCRSIDQLPSAAQNYLKRIEQLTGVPVSWVGVGAGREDMATVKEQ